MTAVDWYSGVAMLVTGLVAGVVLAIVALKHRQLTPDVDMLLRDLDERLEHAVAQLRDLRLQSAKIDPTFLAEQTRELELRAATALRERDELLAKIARGDTITSAPEAPQRRAQDAELSPAMSFLAARPWLRALLWSGGLVAVGAVLAVTVHLEQKPREQGAPMSGGADAAPPQAQSADTELRQLLDRLRERPDDLDALLKLTRRLLRAQMFEEAGAVLERVRAVAPDHPEGQVYAAVLTSAQGDAAGALASLNAITAKHPDLVDAWFFRGMIGMQTNNDTVIVESFEKYVTLAPESPQRERVKAMLEGVKNKKP